MVLRFVKPSHFEIRITWVSSGITRSAAETCFQMPKSMGSGPRTIHRRYRLSRFAAPASANGNR